jgi:cyclopropane-fatty-acyl-phospholipid synthase
MPELLQRPAGLAPEPARRFASWVFGPLSERRFTIRYWDGTADVPPVGAPEFTLAIQSPGALERMFFASSELGLAEAYIHGDFEVEGNLEQATAIADVLQERAAALPMAARVAGWFIALRGSGRRYASWAGSAPWRGLFARHSKARDAAAIRAHYDVGNDFYSLWLDRRLVYSCAYFETGAEDIHTAQEAKLDHICRKLRLARGERMLDVGCGWGALIRHAAQRFGAQSTGVTVSASQAKLVDATIDRDGLRGRCRVYIRDYRDIDETPPYDKAASVGMFEHVGARRLDGYFRKMFRTLRPGALFLNHGIVRAPESERRVLGIPVDRILWRKGEFMDRYVFPDGELVTLDQVVRSAERAGFEVRDIESLREHYALTLRHWVRRLEAAADKAIALVGPERYRVWRLYMAASAHAFASRRIGLAQVLLAKPDRRGRVSIPLTRNDLYPLGRAGAMG